MNATILLVADKPMEVSSTSGYIAGAIIAILILVYLFYSLIKPEKF